MNDDYDEVTKTMNNDGYDDKNTKYYSSSEEMKNSNEIILDPSFHMSSTNTNSNDKSKENSKTKKNNK